MKTSVIKLQLKKVKSVLSGLKRAKEALLQRRKNKNYDIRDDEYAEKRIYKLDEQIVKCQGDILILEAAIAGL